jgi:hypothetical protein
MLTPKEKADELYVGFWYLTNDSRIAKNCALVAVDEILKVTAPIIDRFEPYYQELPSEMTQEYWQEVKQEIENYNEK